MNTTCPNCQTEFNVPDSAYRPGRKARCAVCSYIFILPEVPGRAPAASAQATLNQVPGQTSRPSTQAGANAASPAAPSVPPPPFAEDVPGPGQSVPAAPKATPKIDLPLPEPESFSAAEPEAVLPDDLEDFLANPQREALKEEPAGRLLSEGDAHAAYAQSAAQHAFGAAREAQERAEEEAQNEIQAQAPGQALVRSVGQTEVPLSAATEAAGQDGPGLSFDDFIKQSLEDESVPPATQPKDDLEADLEAILAGASDRVLSGGPEPMVAPVTDSSELDSSGQPFAKKSGAGKKIALALAFIICLSGLGLGGYWIYGSFAGGSRKPAEEQKVTSLDPVELEKIRNLDVKSNGIKYDYIRNDKLGSILVLEGKVTNNFNTPKNRIIVEARLFNSKGELLKSQRQICGVVLSPLQLSVLGQKELVKALNNRIEIMANNMGVMPGQEVPFMVVFVYPPTNAVEFDVTVVDASDTSEPPVPDPQ